MKAVALHKLGKEQRSDEAAGCKQDKASKIKVRSLGKAESTAQERQCAKRRRGCVCRAGS